MTTAIDVNELPRQGDSGGTEEERTREWEVQMSDGLGTEGIALAAVGVNFGDAHPDNPNCVAYKASAKQQSDVAFFIVTANYKTYGITSHDEEVWTQPNPTLRAPRVTGAWEAIRVPAPTDRNGAVIKNSAGQVPDPRFEVDAFLSVYNIVADVTSIPDWVDTYRGRYGATNAAAFRIELQNGQYKEIEKGCAALRDVRHSEYRTENGIGFFELSFTLALRDPPESDPAQEGWVFDMVDMGKMAYAYADPDAGVLLELVPILGQDGQPVSEPVLLDGNGQVLADPTYSAPVILYWDVLTPKDFTILPACSAVA